jgi:hypothetical protein
MKTATIFILIGLMIRFVICCQLEPVSPKVAENPDKGTVEKTVSANVSNNKVAFSF